MGTFLLRNARSLVLCFLAVTTLLGVSCEPDECERDACEEGNIALSCDRPGPEAARSAYRQACAAGATCRVEGNEAFCPDDDATPCSRDTAPSCRDADVLASCRVVGADATSGVTTSISCAYHGLACVELDGVGRCQ